MRLRRHPVNPSVPILATDWSTQQTGHDAVFRRGRWWFEYVWEHHPQGRWSYADDRKERRNRAMRQWLQVQAG